MRDRHSTAAQPLDPDAGDDRIAGYRATYVFDVAQTEGADLPRLEGETGGDPGVHLHALEDAVRAAGVVLLDAEDLDGAEGTSRAGRIEILSGLTSADRFCVLAHEFAHELLHQRGERPASKTVRETEAEAVAFIVGSGIGVSPRVSSCDYIGLYNGSADTLRDSLARIQQTARTILSALDPARPTPSAADAPG